MNKNCKVKAHKRKGKMVKSHSRTVKGAMKNSGAGMSKEECKEKYDAMVLKYGEDSPQAKKLAMKMESMETVEKDSRKKYASITDKISVGKTPAGKKAAKEKELKRKEGLAKKLSKHSRGSYVRKNIDEELLTKEAKAKRKTSPGGPNLGRMKEGLEYSKSGKPVASGKKVTGIEQLKGIADGTIKLKKPKMAPKRTPEDMKDKMSLLRGKKKK